MTYNQLRGRHLCTRCRRRRARPHRSKCAVCAVHVAFTDRAGHLRRKYRLSPAEFEQMLRAQRRGCFVCRRRKTRFVVDHAHTRRAYVRALLCPSCNTSEGILNKIGVRTMRQLLDWATRMAALRMVARWA